LGAISEDQGMRRLVLIVLAVSVPASADSPPKGKGWYCAQRSDYTNSTCVTAKEQCEVLRADLARDDDAWSGECSWRQLAAGVSAQETLGGATVFWFFTSYSHCRPFARELRRSKDDYKRVSKCFESNGSPPKRHD
jgi:hypothetical protein